MATVALGARLAVPGPRPLPVVGGLGHVFRYISDPIGHTGRLFREYGAVVALAAGGGTRLFSPYGAPPGTIFVYGPDLIRQVRTPHGSWDTAPLTGLLYPTVAVSPRKQPLKHFLVWPWVTQREEHRTHRRLVMPALHRQRIAAYRDQMVVIAQSVFDAWRVGTQIDVDHALRELAARIATKTLFGEDIAEHGGAGRTLQEALATLSRPATSLLPYDLAGLPYRRFLDLIARFDGEMRAIIRRKRATGKDDGDILSTLIQARDEASGAAFTED
jgi:cytochrome P450